MDFTHSEDYLATQDLARQIFSGQIDDEYHKQELAQDYDAALWKMLAEAGLIGVASSEQHGGIGLGFLELTAVLTEQGKTLAPVPLYPTLVVANLLERLASESLAASILPDVIQGKGHLALALGDHVRESLGNTLKANNGRVSGVVNDIAYGKDAAVILFAVHDEEGPALYALEAGNKAATLELQETTYRQPHYQLQLNDLELDDARLLRGADVVEAAMQAAYTAVAALQLGVVNEALQRTAAYTMERQQFGKPLASFQAVSHRAADGYIDTQTLRASVMQSAWRLSEGRDASTESRTAKWWAAEAGHRISHTAQHLHGGIGADISYPIHRYFRWAKQLEFTLGGSQEQLAQTGRLLAERGELGIEV